MCRMSENQIEVKQEYAFTMIHCLYEISAGFISHFLNVSDFYCILYVLPGIHKNKRGNTRSSCLNPSESVCQKSSYRSIKNIKK